MKVVILAGGFGTRLSEETYAIPKPLVQVGDKPILWHIIKIYEKYGFDEFVIALGYKSEKIKQYFLDYREHSDEMTIDMRNKSVEHRDRSSDRFRVTLVETGLETMTGGRVKRLQDVLNGEDFAITYGDGLSDVRLDKVYEQHKCSGDILTLTAVRPVARFGELRFDGQKVSQFKEKPQTEEGWINGGFMFASNGFLEYLEGDEEVLEGKPMDRLIAEGKLGAYKHSGFWQCMDTLRDKRYLDRLWEEKKAPWLVRQ